MSSLHDFSLDVILSYIKESFWIIILLNCISHYKLKTIYFKGQRWCIQEIVNPRNLLDVIQIHWTCIHPQHYDITKKFSKVYLRKNSNLEMGVYTQNLIFYEKQSRVFEEVVKTQYIIEAYEIRSLDGIYGIIIDWPNP